MIRKFLTTTLLALSVAACGHAAIADEVTEAGLYADLVSAFGVPAIHVPEVSAVVAPEVVWGDFYGSPAPEALRVSAIDCAPRKSEAGAIVRVFGDGSSLVVPLVYDVQPATFLAERMRH